jgi:hypothetical protein
VLNFPEGIAYGNNDDAKEMDQGNAGATCHSAVRRGLNSVRGFPRGAKRQDHLSVT